MLSGLRQHDQRFRREIQEFAEVAQFALGDFLTTVGFQGQMDYLTDNFSIRLALVMPFQVHQHLQQLQVLSAVLLLVPQFGELGFVDDGQALQSKECRPDS